MSDENQVYSDADMRSGMASFKRWSMLEEVLFYLSIAWYLGFALFHDQIVGFIISHMTPVAAHNLSLVISLFFYILPFSAAALSVCLYTRGQKGGKYFLYSRMFIYSYIYLLAPVWTIIKAFFHIDFPL